YGHSPEEQFAKLVNQIRHEKVSPKISGRQPRRLPDPVGAYGGPCAALRNNNLYHSQPLSVNESPCARKAQNRVPSYNSEALVMRALLPNWRAGASMTKTWQTKLIHSDAKIPAGYKSLATPTYRGSTTVFPSAAVVKDTWDQHKVGYTYGLYGTPTALELAARICELESGKHTILAPGGQAAISLIALALLQAGDHILVPASVYYPNRKLTTHLLSRFGVTATFYDPLIGAGISAL